MPDELAPGSYVEDIPSAIKEITGVPTDRAAFIGRALQGPVNEPVTVSSFGDFERLFGELWLESYLGYAVRDFFLNGGRQAIIVRLVHGGPGSSGQLTELIPSRSGITEAKIAAARLTLDDFIGPGREDSRQGLYALEKVDFFNLLYIPPYKDDANVDPELMAAAAAYCEKRRAFLIIDPPSQWQIWTDFYPKIEDIGTHSKNAAVYFPRLLQSNPRLPNSLKLEPFPPGGAVAGVFARTDYERGVWKSPAGYGASITGYQKLALKDAHNQVVKDADIPQEFYENLNSSGINCLRSFPGQGLIIWGSHTLAEDPGWKYISVRRLALYIEESLCRGTVVSCRVFEPQNDAALWTKIRQMVEIFLHGLWRNGALQGKTAQEAYFVRCGLNETMTQHDIDQGFVILEVGYAPVKPAGFFIIRLQQITGQTKP